MKGSNQPMNRSSCGAIACSSTCFRGHQERQEAPQDAIDHSIGNWDFLKSLPVGVFHLNPNSEFLAVSDRWAQMTGLSATTVPGQRWTGLVHPGDRGAVEAAWQHALATNSPFQAEYRWHSPVQPTLWVLGQLVAQKNAQGDILSYVGTITDITAQ